MSVPRHLGLTMIVACGIAVVFHAYSAVTEWNDGIYGLLMFGWSLGPYVAAVLISVLTKNPLVGAISAPLALGVDLWTYVAVRSSENSTAAIDFLWAPIFNLFFVVPLAALTALLISKLRRAGRNAP